MCFKNQFGLDIKLCQHNSTQNIHINVIVFLALLSNRLCDTEPAAEVVRPARRCRSENPAGQAGSVSYWENDASEGITDILGGFFRVFSTAGASGGGLEICMSTQSQASHPNWPTFFTCLSSNRISYGARMEAADQPRSDKGSSCRWWVVRCVYR